MTGSPSHAWAAKHPTLAFNLRNNATSLHYFHQQALSTLAKQADKQQSTWWPAAALSYISVGTAGMLVLSPTAHCSDDEDEEAASADVKDSV